ncbi:MAG: hypothetical protein H6Q20_2450 [Bacteroidetes bacterium]|nr:hypothetical protein [Bacteroidota bacterium]
MKRILLFSLMILCSLGLFAQDEFKKANFSEKFKKENQGKVKIEIDEVKELLHIMIAITEVGLENDDMVAQTGDYYKDVIQNFKRFENEAIILKFDSIMKSNPVYYIFLTGNALSYNFKGGKLVEDKTYIFPAQSVSSHTTVKINPITTYKKEIEDFAKKSGFRKFFKSHKDYYNKIISDYNRLADLQKQWDWLESKCKTQVNNYTIMCSPLINGLNYTTSYTDNGFKQIMMVLPPVEEDPKLSQMDNIVLNTRIMFTEIDHNYVSNPTTQNKELIDNVFKNREEWVDTTKYGTEYYPNPERVFNEYMTFGLFLIYCKDNFSPDVAEKANQQVAELMTDRGFSKMKIFTENLLKIYDKNQNNKVDDWYPEFINSFSK